MSDSILFYGLKTCGTCRKAKKWLKENGVAFEERAIRETPPSPEELDEWVQGDNLKPFMNTSSKDYREQGLSKRTVTKADYLELTQKTPNLLKRPITVWPKGVLFGFKLDRFEEMLGE